MHNAKGCVLLAWPEGKERNPSCSLSRLVVVQIAEVTSPKGIPFSAPGSGRHLAMMSGRGLPTRTLMTVVIEIVKANERISPSTAAWRSCRQESRQVVISTCIWEGRDETRTAHPNTTHDHQADEKVKNEGCQTYQAQTPYGQSFMYGIGVLKGCICNAEFTSEPMYSVDEVDLGTDTQGCELGRTPLASTLAK